MKFQTLSSLNFWRLGSIMKFIWNFQLLINFAKIVQMLKVDKSCRYGARVANNKVKMQNWNEWSILILHGGSLNWGWIWLSVWLTFSDLSQIQMKHEACLYKTVQKTYKTVSVYMKNVLLING